MGGRGTSGSEEDLSSLPPHPQGSHLSLCQGQALRVTLDAGAGVSPNLFGPDPSGPSQAAATTRGADGGRIQMRRGLPCTDFSIPELPARTLSLEVRGPPGLASACPSHSSRPCHPQPTPPMNWLRFSGNRTGTIPGAGKVRAAKDQSDRQDCGLSQWQKGSGFDWIPHLLPVAFNTQLQCYLLQKPSLIASAERRALLSPLKKTVSLKTLSSACRGP